MKVEMEERHAHEVMEMMVASSQPYNRASLVAAIDERFGAGLVVIEHGLDRLERDRDQPQARGDERRHQGPLSDRPAVSAISDGPPIRP